MTRRQVTANFGDKNEISPLKPHFFPIFLEKTIFSNCFCFPDFVLGRRQAYVGNLNDDEMINKKAICSATNDTRV